MCAPALDLAGAQPQLLVGDFDGFLTSLNPVDGKHLWQQAVVERITSPSIGPGSPMIAAPPLIGSDGTIYLGSRDGAVTALDPRGMVRWRYKSGSDISATPVLGHDGALYVGLYDQRLLALDPRGGIRWQASVRGAVRAAPTYAADGTLYVVTIGGVVYAFTPA
jgi:outer membrane protein assembly factor BamB